MIDFISDEQKDRLFEKFIVSASDILAEEFGLPKRTFAELQAMIEKRSEDTSDNDVNED